MSFEPSHRPVPSVLSPWQARRLIEFVGECLDHALQPLLARDLKKTIGRSVAHFGRLFRQSLGLEPNANVIGWRVERTSHLTDDHQGQG